MMYTPQEKKLAYEIADALNDRDMIDIHLRFTTKYREVFLRDMLVRVMSRPEDKIQVSRAAYYMALIKKYGGQADNYRH